MTGMLSELQNMRQEINLIHNSSLRAKCQNLLQKTDDKEFFDYSFSQFVKFGFDTEEISKKLDSGEIENVQSEYERKFRSSGFPIYALSAVKRD